MGMLTAGFAAEDPTGVALVDESGTCTWAELDARVDRAVTVLDAAGLGEGDVVAAVLGNQRELFELSLACMEGGFLLVPVNWHWVAEELEHVLVDAGAAALVVDERWRTTADGATFGGVRFDVGAGGGWEAALAAVEPATREAVRGGAMFYTSGTTGRPKGVRGSLAVVGGDPVMWQLMAGMADTFGLPAEDPVFLLAGPAYHSAQWVFSIFSLLRGATVVAQHRFDPAGLLDLVGRHRVTTTLLVPTQLTRLLRLPEHVRAAADTSSLRSVVHGAAPCPEPLKRAVLDWLGPVVQEFYGGTEGGFLTFIDAEEWLARPGSVGRAVPIVEIVVLDDEGEPVPAGTTGQIWFRSTVGSDFEYHNAPDKTAAAHRGAGLGTLGDVGHLDEDGYLYLSDRTIDMIISGGVNIYPAEIEQVLVTHPDVDEAAVVGVPDDEFGESVLAVVEAPGAGPSLPDELDQACRTHLAGYKRPRRYVVVDALPRSEMGKVLKRRLREDLASAAADVARRV